MLFIIGYLVLGIFVGFLSGIFGIGGGVVLVPILVLVLETIGTNPEVVMHLALGTSLSCIFVNSLNAVATHRKNNNLDTQIFKKLIIGIIPGSILGSFIAGILSSHTLEVIFAIFLTFVIINMGLKSLKRKEQEKRNLPILLYAFVGLVIGMKSAILGVGGGTISIPFLTWTGEKMKKAVGVSASIGLPISFFGMLTYIFNGLGNRDLPAYSLGYVFVPAFLGIACTSWYFARLGANISNNISHKKLTWAFIVFLIVITAKAYIQLFN